MVRILVLCGMCLCSCAGEEKKAEVDNAYDDYEIADEAETHRGPRTHTVEIIQMKFIPEMVSVSRGDTIVWMNRDIVEHDVTEFDTHLWSSSRLAAGASWRMVAVRSESYFCSLHVVMKGRIVVDGVEIAMAQPVAGISICD